MRGGAAADRRSNETSKRLDGTGHRPWFTALLARRSTKVAAVALANKIAPNGMGDDGQGRALQRAHRTCSVDEIAPTPA